MAGLMNYVGKVKFQSIRILIYFFLHLSLLDHVVIVILKLLSDAKFRCRVAPNIVIATA